MHDHPSSPHRSPEPHTLSLNAPLNFGNAALAVGAGSPRAATTKATSSKSSPTACTAPAVNTGRSACVYRRQDHLGRRQRPGQPGVAAAIPGGRLESRLQLRTVQEERHHGPAVDPGLGSRRGRPRPSSRLRRRPFQRRRHYVRDRDDLEPLFIEQWHSHIAPDLHVHTISALGQELKNIESQLDEAVAAARAEGISWDRIGRAFGITRQGARKRWDKTADRP